MAERIRQRFPANAVNLIFDLWCQRHWLAGDGDPKINAGLDVEFVRNAG
jgi:hypothetical protein